MKAVVFAGRAALCAAVLAAASASAALEGWWRFAEPEADASEDLSGNGRHVFLATNAVLKASDGPGGGSAWFDGRSDAKPHPGEFAYAFAPDFDESSVTGAFTVAAWVCPGAAGRGEAYISPDIRKWISPLREGWSSSCASVGFIPLRSRS